MKKINPINKADIAEFEANGGKTIPVVTPCCNEAFQMSASSEETGYSDHVQCPFCKRPFSLSEGKNSSFTS